MRDIHLGVHLPFETEADQDDSEDVLMRLLGLLSRMVLMHRRRNPGTPRLYDSGVVYALPDQIARSVPASKLRRLERMLREDLGLEESTVQAALRLVAGIEEFLDLPSLYRRGRGDCNELAPIRVGELWEAGVPASPLMTKRIGERGNLVYHALVLWPDGSSEDPSLILGMRQPEKAAERSEEIRKNLERFDQAWGMAEESVARGADPAQAGAAVEALGLLPLSGRFAWPPRRASRQVPHRAGASSALSLLGAVAC